MEKKQKFIYWLIGLGCGMMLSGLAMTFVGLNLEDQGKTVTPVQIAPVFEKGGHEKTDISQGEQFTQQQEVKEQGQDVHEMEITSVEDVYKWVYIPETYSATQISQLLEKEGIIEESSKFRDYIASQKMTKKLRSGNKYLPIRGEYDAILTLLTTDALN